MMTPELESSAPELEQTIESELSPSREPVGFEKDLIALYKFDNPNITAEQLQAAQQKAKDIEDLIALTFPVSGGSAPAQLETFKKLLMLHNGVTGVDQLLKNKYIDFKTVVDHFRQIINNQRDSINQEFFKKNLSGLGDKISDLDLNIPLNKKIDKMHNFFYKNLMKEFNALSRKPELPRQEIKVTVKQLEKLQKNWNENVAFTKPYIRTTEFGKSIEVERLKNLKDSSIFLADLDAHIARAEPHGIQFLLEFYSKVNDKTSHADFISMVGATKARIKKELKNDKVPYSVEKLFEFLSGKKNKVNFAEKKIKTGLGEKIFEVLKNSYVNKEQNDKNNLIKDIVKHYGDNTIAKEYQNYFSSNNKKNLETIDFIKKCTKNMGGELTDKAIVDLVFDQKSMSKLNKEVISLLEKLKDRESRQILYVSKNIRDRFTIFSHSMQNKIINPNEQMNWRRKFEADWASISKELALLPERTQKVLKEEALKKIISKFEDNQLDTLVKEYVDRNKLNGGPSAIKTTQEGRDNLAALEIKESLNLLGSEKINRFLSDLVKPNSDNYEKSPSQSRDLFLNALSFYGDNAGLIEYFDGFKTLEEARKPKADQLEDCELFFKMIQYFKFDRELSLRGLIEVFIRHYHSNIKKNQTAPQDKQLKENEFIQKLRAIASPKKKA